MQRDPSLVDTDEQNVNKLISSTVRTTGPSGLTLTSIISSNLPLPTYQEATFSGEDPRFLSSFSLEISSIAGYEPPPGSSYDDIPPSAILLYHTKAFLQPKKRQLIADTHFFLY